MDGHDFIEDAIEAGASGIAGEKNLNDFICPLYSSTQQPFSSN